MERTTVSFARINDSEDDERQEQHTYQPAVVDPVSVALAASVFVSKHRFDVHIETQLGRSPRLYVSRYYWSLNPPVAVDFVRDMAYGPKEEQVKRAFFGARNIRYLILVNEFDDEAILGTPAPPSAGSDGESEESPPVETQKPVVAPRRRNPSKRR